MGLYGYFSSLAVEVADTNVGVTIVCPGKRDGGMRCMCSTEAWVTRVRSNFKQNLELF